MRCTPGLALSRRLAAALLLAACACGRPSHLFDRTAIAFRGHQELSDSLPVVLGRDAPIGICLEPVAERDTSQWNGRLSIGATRATDEGFAPPAQRLEATLCFERTVPAELADGPTELCLEVEDRYDEARDRTCIPFVFRAADAEHARILGRLREVLTHGAPVAELDSLAREAAANDLPFLELRLRLIATYMLRRAGTDGSRAQASDLVAASPPWIESPAAASWAAQLAYERATLALDAGELERAWTELRRAEDRFRAVADPKWIVAVTKQVEILSRVGALGEAQDRLRFALDSCTAAPCEPRLARVADTMLSWLVLLDPDADGAALERTENALRSVLESMGEKTDARERANVIVNVAYARERRGLDPLPELVQARALLADESELAGWSQLIEGLHLTRLGRLDRGVSDCEAVLNAAGASRLRSWAATCSASALRLQGELDRAADRLALAWLLGERAAGTGLDQVIPIGPGQRAETAYRAARVALERGLAAEAWQILARLDGLAFDAARTTGGERESLLAELAALEAPAAPARREQRLTIRRKTLERLQELARARATPDDARAIDDPGVAFRAFAVEDEVVLLHRSPGGGPALYRRTTVPRAELLRAIGELSAAMEERGTDEARWREIARPLSAALVPETGDLGTVTTFALHGVLQSVPLHALPDRGGDGWLAERTAVAYRPAGAATRSVEPAGAGTQLFVVDPRATLARRGAARFYRSVAPGARVLEGAEATGAALERELPGARSLHLDTHARYDAAFPELSVLELADRSLTAQQLVDWGPHLELANLSACHSGSWPVTADSGRFGLAGALTRAGVAWVIASRTELDDALAADFNRAFYVELARTGRVPDAFRSAVDRVRNGHAASSWAGLLLLDAGGADSGGQIGERRTLLTSESKHGDRS